MKSLKDTSSLTNSFQLIAITPPGVLDPTIAIAASRSKGIGIFNLEFAHDPEAALSAIERLVTNAGYPCGIKLNAANSLFNAALIPNLPASIGIVILTYSNSEKLAQYIRELRAHSRLVFLEALSLEHAQHGYDLKIDGIVAKGNEAAGFIGEKTAFILFQQIVSNLSLPVWVQGGIGLNTAAACYAGGAAGIVLDSQLYLTKESPFSNGIKKHLKRVDGSETICLGNKPVLCRIYNRPGLKIDDASLNIDQQPEHAQDTEYNAVSLLRQYIQKHIAWDEAESSLWPLGQDIAFAASLAQRFGTVGSIVHAIRETIREHVQTVKSLKILNEGSPLATSHGTRYPIVQGPMARISDKAAFLAQVAEGGALPMVALSKLRSSEIKEVLSEVKKYIGEHLWGVGLLGFIETDLLKSQIEAIEPFSPKFAIIAGGLPNQVSVLESKGIATYVHVPSPGILDMFVDSGARRFIFEGYECGGHIGPRSSFVLWETMVEKLLEKFKEGYVPEQFHVLFAGGIHDALSASMVAAIAAPLAKHGAKVGVQMGTAYLFTEEIVETGALIKGYQKNVLHCSDTCVLEISPGHALRCCDTPFVRLFEDYKRRLKNENLPSGEISSQLDKLIIGRSRIASKGVTRNPAFGSKPDSPYKVPVNDRKQQKEGLYMTGQLAALRDKTLRIGELHYDVSMKSSEMLASLTPLKRSATTEKPSDIAIIGMASVFPKAGNLWTYWENILNKVNAISEVPARRWDWKLYFDEDKKARDKIYSRWGGFLDDMSFDPLKYGIPPTSLSSIEPLHLMTLEVVSAALKDAGYETKEFLREKTSVIIGTGTSVGDVGQNYVLRASLPALFDIDSDEVFKRLNEWTEDSFPGILMNVLAGRVANRFNLGGINYTIDAACASSLAALYNAARELENGSSDMVIVGGVDASQNPFTFTCFSKTNALSPSGVCRVFDEKADGTVISEGLAILVLKRLEDAERDGDRIYAVLKSIAGSSDGRGTSMTAPRVEGQLLALNRAYTKAGFSSADVELFEAHGTGTVVGDQVEAESLIRLLNKNNAAKQSCAVGSVKSMIGHAKGAAGLAGTIKVALSLYHKVLPPTLGVEKPNSKVDFNNGPLYVNTELRPWVGKKDVPRRAGVSAFGFGGTNFHAVIEEYKGKFMEGEEPAAFQNWPSELFLWSGQSRSEIVSALKMLQSSLEEAGNLRLGDLAYTFYKMFKENDKDEGKHRARLAIVASSLNDLREKLSFAVQSLNDESNKNVFDRKGIFFTDEGHGVQGRVAFLFPGQGSQYANMLRESAVFFPEVLRCFERANTVLGERFPEGLSGYIFPPPSFTVERESEQKKKLSETNIAQPSLGASCYGIFTLLQKMGLHADMTAGHSYGEYVALAAAGVFDEDTLYAISESRGRFIIEAAQGNDLGTMAAVRQSASELKEAIKDIDGVVIANINSPQQTVISGERNVIQRVAELLKSKDVQVHLLPVAGAFHSHLVAPAKKLFSDFLKTIRFNPPEVEVFSNSFAEPYGSSPEEIQSCLAEHMVRPVEFVRQIEAMYKRGARFFIEVGPGSVLTNLVKQILEGRPVLAVATDIQGQSSLTQLLRTLGQLSVNGVQMSLDRLYQGRNLKTLNLNALEGETKEKVSPATYLVNSKGIFKPGKVWKERADKGVLAEYRLKDRRLSQEPKKEPAKDKTFKASSERETLRVPEKHITPQSFFEKLENIGAQPLTNTDMDAVMFQFQQLMGRFLETQKSVMMAYLQGTSQPGESDRLGTLVSSQQQVQDMLEKGSYQSQEPATFVPPAVEESGPEPSPEKQSELAFDSLREELIRITSERTGYPKEMLNLDSDIEADLGIDSIKRVEIMSSFMKYFDDAAKQKIQTIMDEISKLKTLNSILQRTSEVILPGLQKHEEVAESAANKTGEYALPVQNILNKDTIQEELLRVTSERTGYPKEMLNLDSDIEADLGIDSIKRVEILGAFVRSFPEAERQKFQVSIDEISKLRTLRSIIEKSVDICSPGDLKSIVSQTAQVTSDKALPPDRSIRKDGDEHLPRFLLEPIEAPFPKETLQIGNGVFLITDDGGGVADTLAQELRRLGGEAVILQMGSSEIKDDGTTYSADLTDPLDVNSLITGIRSKYGPIAALIHLLPLGHSVPFSEMDLNAWRNYLKVEIKSLFYLAKELGADLRDAGRKNGGWFLAATALQGKCFDANKEDCFVGQAGIAGLIKTLYHEWPEVKCRVVHMDLNKTHSILSEQLIQEITTKDNTFEVGYEGSKRFRYLPRLSNLRQSSVPKIQIQKDWVIMITGGAIGITAEVAYEFAVKYQPTLVLVGRSAFPDTESPETTELTSPDTLKRALINKLGAGGSTPNPVQVEAAYMRLLKDREIRQNVKKMQAAGANVEYFQADVRDEQSFGGLIDDIYRSFGRLDGIVHGAGIIEDKLLEDKKPDSFDRVFDTKTDSAFILSRKIRGESLEFAVFFTSITGTFGNKGQTDYAAANEVVNELAVLLDRKWKGRIVAINWGPWKKAGMVTPEVERQFRERGVHLITLPAGRRKVDEELSYGSKGDVKIIIGDGPWGRIAADISPSLLNEFLPLLNHTCSSFEFHNDTLQVQKRLAPDHDLYLQDHCLDGKPVLPAAVAVEIMAEAAKHGWPDWNIASILDVHVFKGVILDNGVTDVRIIAKPNGNSDPKKNYLELDIKISEVEKPDRISYSSKVILNDRVPVSLVHKFPDASAMNKFPMSVESAYRKWLFHGPRFHCIKSIEGISEKGIIATFIPSSPDDCLTEISGSHWLVDPVMLDGGLQLVWLWSRANKNMSALPSRFKAVHLFNANNANTSSIIRCHLEIIEGIEGHTVHSNIYFTDPEGRVLCMVEDFESSCSKSLNRLAVKETDRLKN